MVWILCVFTLFLSSCQQKPEERHYTEVVTEEPAAAPLESAANMNSDPHTNLEMSDIDMMPSTTMNTIYSWVAPEGWLQEPGKGFRLASFHLRDDINAIDVSVISLEGAAGGLEPNLRRWMGQIGMEDTDLTELMSSASAIGTPEGKVGKVYDFTTIQTNAAASDKSMIVVMLPMANDTLFVKMTGTVETVTEHRLSFLQFVQTIVHKDFASPPETDMKDPHAGLNMDMKSLGAMMDSGPASESAITWEVPAGWSEAATSPMRLATFRLTSDPNALDCSIISLGGPAGGVEANLTRWAGQLGLVLSGPDLARFASDTAMIKTKDGMDVSIYDFTVLGKNNKPADQSMIVAMFTLDDSTIFVKMSASIEVIQQNKDAFLKLIRSIAHK